MQKEHPGRRGMANKNSQPSSSKRLTVKTTTKSHRFTHYIKADREVLLRSPPPVALL